MSENAQNNPHERRALVEAIIASTIGTTIEWYDFFLYGTAAALVFPQLFFPELDPFIAQLASFSTFMVGFLARPLGGVIFGHFGDRFGRKSSLVATLLLMGISTLLIGFLPTYEQIGLCAPLALTLLRFIQGIGVGGEWGGAVLLALEYGHGGKRGFYASWPQAGVPLGLLLSTIVMAFCQGLLAKEAFESWGWRLPFFLSGLLIVVGLLIRARILETPLFRERKEANQLSAAPIREVLVTNWREILLAAGVRLTENASFYLFSTYVISYGKDVLKVPEWWLLLAVAIASTAQFITIPLYGMLSDIWTRKRMYSFGCIALALCAFPYYGLLETREFTWIVFATVVVLAGAHAMLYSVQASLIPELFATKVRYSGASISYQLASIFGGGPAPLIAAWLVHHFPGHFWPLASYIIVLSVLSLTCVVLLAETSTKDLRR